MRFEFTYALLGLDKKTPKFFVNEIFAHGDLTSRKQALQILQNLGCKPKATQMLISMLDAGIHPTENFPDRIF